MFDTATRVTRFVVLATFTLVVKMLEVVRAFVAYALVMSRVVRFEVPNMFR